MWKATAEYRQRPKKEEVREVKTVRNWKQEEEAVVEEEKEREEIEETRQHEAPL